MLARNSAGGVLVAFLLAVFCTSSLFAQDFQNLDFEEANVPVLPVNGTAVVSVTNGLPGWSAYIGTNQLTTITENVVTLGSPNLGILGPNYLTPTQGLQFQPLQGLFSAILQPGFPNGQAPAQSASIAQTGLIPSWANSVQFEGTNLFGSGLQSDFGVTVGGESTTIVPLGGNLYGCNVSAFSGLEEELSFTALTNYGDGLFLLDAISFSPQVIPEPSALGLVMIAMAALGLRRLTFQKTR